MHEAAVKAKGKRLPTFEEVERHMDNTNKPLWKNVDYWCPVYDWLRGGSRDYIQVGDGGIYVDHAHRPGRSHTLPMGWPYPGHGAWAEKPVITHTGEHKKDWCEVPVV